MLSGSGQSIMKKSSFLSRLSRFGLCTFFLLIITAFMPYIISGSRYDVPEISELQGVPVSPESGNMVKVMTLNLAHGRSTDFSQLLLSKKRIEINLERVSSVILREKPDIAGFQEADGNSFWSGGHDHIRYISEKSGFSFFMHGYHIKAPYLSYGTAIASRLAVRYPAAITFAPSVFSPPKGFSAMSFKWPGTDLYVDALVLHLDFMSESARNRQIEETASFAEKRGFRPMIVMGDFNSSWDYKDSSVKKICSLLKLKAYRPDEKTLSTFPLTGGRIDWILVSEQMDFKSYRVIEDRISDHLGVVSEISLN